MSKYPFLILSLLLGACSSVPHGTTEYFSSMNPDTRKVEHLSYVTYDTPGLKKLFRKDSNIQLVDVRTIKEYEKGHIEKAILIDVRNVDFADRADKLLDEKRPVAVYCKGGVRSREAAKILSGKGFTVYNLDKGYDDWIKY